MLSTMFAAPSNAITGKRRIEPQQFDGASRRSAVDMAVRPNRWAPSAPNRNAISTTSGFAVSACPTRDGSQMALSNFFSCDAPYPGSVSIWSLFRSQREVATSQQPAHADARCPARKARRPGEPCRQTNPHHPTLCWASKASLSAVIPPWRWRVSRAIGPSCSRSSHFRLSPDHDVRSRGTSLARWCQ